MVTPPPPPHTKITPSKNPKSYQPPLLKHSYILTFLENREMIKVMIEIIPCHSPAQNPAGFAAFQRVGSPAAHPRKTTANKIKNTGR
jgi:hypothetical protein